jgi:hypothetical protein
MLYKFIKPNSFVWIIAFTVLFTIRSFAQISPGELSKYHSQLEGMSNCTQCHTLGSKVSNDKCLACHTEIKQRVEKKKGYHASTEVKGKECVSCHNDHHGKNFQIVHFDEQRFQHNYTGFKLEGVHRKTKCNDCHSTKFITSEKIKSKSFTYLGLESQCISCHADYHQKTLSNTCSNCHGFESFKPAPKFNHATTKFPLLGKHQVVDCAKCHKIETKEGKNFQNFKGIQFNNCNSCHKDVHQNKFGQDCRQCHNETSFQTIKGTNNFDHSKTGFVLAEKHLNISCNLCHKTKYTDPIKHDKCIDCHSDYHNGQFIELGITIDCSKCHTVKGFTETGFTIEQHNLGDFILDGLHQTTACSACHKKTEKWNFREIGKTCTDCHTDYHNGQFIKLGVAPNCSQCHTTKGFSIVNYSIIQHNQCSFKLQGSHVATPCNECHKKGETWNFRNIGKVCIDCHIDIHKSFIPAKYYAGSNCTQCHTENSWSNINFDHSKTNFNLEGVHSTTSCRSCHFGKKMEGHELQKFSGLTTSCSNCHTDNHFRQFDKNGSTNCTECHTAENWKASKFDHNKTAFKLDGEHINVACAKCHKPSTTESYIIYKIKDFRCEACHF